MVGAALTTKIVGIVMLLVVTLLVGVIGEVEEGAALEVVTLQVIVEAFTAVGVVVIGGDVDADVDVL
uniref:Uncharacterized protein n=1 Tax=Setaria viridis TaxID=4556 RepID=A0A4U6U462_SETVI|nr:hypothetical protein SEVIR_6G160066v2 [Setaria viridis]